jgi:hypothetical protein
MLLTKNILQLNQKCACAVICCSLDRINCSLLSTLSKFSHHMFKFLNRQLTAVLTTAIHLHKCMNHEQSSSL